MNTPDSEHKPDRAGIILFCDQDTRILSVVRDTLGIAGDHPAGTCIADIVEPSTREKLARFFSVINTEHAVFDGELDLLVRGNIIAMKVMGVKVDEKFLIVGDTAALDITHIFDEIMTINNEQTNTMRAIIKQYAMKLQSKDEYEYQAVNNLSALNNELINLQRDITKRNIEFQKVNAELEEAKQILEEVTHGITESILLISREYKILWANDAARQLAQGELVGEYCYKATHNIDSPCRLPADPCPITHLLETGETKEAEHIHTDLAGQQRFAEVTAYPVKDDQGEVVKFVHISRDITERKKMASEREKLIGELQGALAKVKQLSGFLPICASCKKIRDDKGYWKQIEFYIRDHSEAEFSHGLCPDCAQKLYPGLGK